MSSTSKSILLTLALLSGALFSCTTANKDYAYTDIDPSGFDIRDTVSFVVEMTDTASIYDIYICSRLSSDFKFDTIELYVELTSPSGNRYYDNISLPSDFYSLKKSKTSIKKSAGWYDVEWGYRKNIEPQEYGRWRLSLLIRNGGSDYMIKGIKGIGVYCNERKR